MFLLFPEKVEKEQWDETTSGIFWKKNKTDTVLGKKDRCGRGVVASTFSELKRFISSFLLTIFIKVEFIKFHKAKY